MAEGEDEREKHKRKKEVEFCSSCREIRQILDTSEELKKDLDEEMYMSTGVSAAVLWRICGIYFDDNVMRMEDVAK